MNMKKVVGCPPKYKKVEELQRKIEEYFRNPPETKIRFFKLKDEVIEKEVPCVTITGLAIYLGFESRQSFYDYEKRKKFSYTIKRARIFIENTYEKLLQEGNTVGAIFALKNFGWEDKFEHKHEGNLNVRFRNMSDDELREFITRKA